MKTKSCLFVAVFLQCILFAGLVQAQSGINQLSEISSVEAKTKTTSGTDATQLKDALEKSGVDTTPAKTYYYLSNMFLKDNIVLTLDGSNRLVMAARNSKNDRQKWQIVADKNNYYRLYNKALGEGMAVDSDTKKPHMAKKGNYSGQYWLFTLAPGNQVLGGWYKLSNMYQGVNKVLDTYNSPGNHLFFETKTKNTSGTFWRKTEVRDDVTFKPLSLTR